MPQARHGGNGNEEFAFEESKFDGTGLEKEQIGQTHVPDDFGTSACTEGDRNGLLVLVTGEDDDASLCTDLGLGESILVRGEPKPCCNGLG
jgi:hypothetical protein